MIKTHLTDGSNNIVDKENRKKQLLKLKKGEKIDQSSTDIIDEPNN